VIVPPLQLQVTEVFPVPPVTVATNVCVCPYAREALVGLILTETGATTVRVALSDLEGSETLVAVTE
jgi:hypothetical protein